MIGGIPVKRSSSNQCCEFNFEKSSYTLPVLYLMVLITLQKRFGMEIYQRRDHQLGELRKQLLDSYSRREDKDRDLILRIDMVAVKNRL